MSQSNLYKVIENIDHVSDIVGADVSRDLLKVAITQQDVASLTVDVQSGSIDVTDRSGRILGSVSVSNTVATDLSSALASSGTDSLLVDSNTALDVSAAAVKPDETPQTAALASGVDIASGVSAVLPTDDNTLFVSVDSMGDATTIDVTIEYSPDSGTTWYPDPSGAINFTATGSTILEVGYQATDVRVSSTSDFTSTAPTYSVDLVSR